MSEKEVLAINTEIDNLISAYDSNKSIQEIIYDILINKEIRKCDLRNRAIYREYIEKIKKQRTSVIMIYSELSDVYNLEIGTIQRIVLDFSKYS